MMIDRRDFLRLSLAHSAVACLRLAPVAAFAAVHRPIVLLLGNVPQRHSFVAGFSEALTTDEWHAKPLASAQHDLEIWTLNLRSLRGSRLVYLGDDRDQLLLQLVLAGLDARLLCSGHHGGSRLLLCPLSAIKRTSAASAIMSAKCHVLTIAPPD